MFALTGIAIDADADTEAAAASVLGIGSSDLTLRDVACPTVMG
ncbi:hypothetical protein ACXX82_10535 [Glaciimonas sp. GNP009]|nr:hypothetical protein [Glaciimonas sp. CA11.2]MDY7546022.1 hypothetical protein [Glaciimonas sp. CA11.2]